MKKTLSVFVISLLIASFANAASSIASQLSGKILLQVESHGEAWYVNPDNLQRYYLGRPTDAFNLMRSLGLGISNRDIAKIPVAVEASTGLDTDDDGLSDLMEVALGTNKLLADSDNDTYTDLIEIQSLYNPNGSGRLETDSALIDRLNGKILLQVEQNGEAWYLNPENGKRYFLGKPADAFAVMRSVGLGITNANLSQIEVLGGQTQAVACGEALLTESTKENGDVSKMLGERQQLKVVYDCLKKQYEVCQPALGSINQGFSLNHYEIVGLNAGACEVKVTYSDSPFEQLNGETTTCQMDRGRSLFIEVNNLLTCKGGSYQDIPKESLVGWSITDSKEIFTYSDAEIVWLFEITSGNKMSQSTGVTTITINNQGYNMNSSGKLDI